MKILIDTDWFAAIQDLAPNKRREVINALINYPNGESDTNLWKKTIKPNLELGSIKYFNKIKNLKQNNPANTQKTGKKIPDSDTDSGRRIIYIEKENSNKGVIGGEEKGEKTNIKGEFVPPTMEEVLTYAKNMNDHRGVGGFMCSKDMVIEFFDHYNRQGWMLGNGIHMTNWQSALKKWCTENIKKIMER